MEGPVASLAGHAQMSNQACLSLVGWGGKGGDTITACPGELDGPPFPPSASLVLYAQAHGYGPVFINPLQTPPVFSSPTALVQAPLLLTWAFASACRPRHLLPGRSRPFSQQA